MVTLKVFIVLICFVYTILALEKSEFLLCGYEHEPIDVITEDEHILRMFRMTKKDDNSTKFKTPVLLVHGIAGYSDNYLYHPDSLGYQLVDAGFDLFLGNLRGNTFTRHVKYDRSDNRYWDFGVEEIAKYDLPALIESVLNITNSEKLHLITYSLSFIEYLMTLNYRPDISSKIKQLVGMAPTITAQGYYRLAGGLSLIGWDKIMMKRESNLVMPQQTFSDIVMSICKPVKVEHDFCAHLVLFTTGDDINQIDTETFPIKFANYQMSSTRQVIHLQQIIISNQLKAFDYGFKKNVEKYGSIVPPKFKVTNIVSPVCLFFGKGDVIQPVAERFNIANEIRKSANVTIHSVPYKKFGHLSFIYAKNAGTQVNKNIVKCLTDRENSND